MGKPSILQEDQERGDCPWACNMPQVQTKPLQNVLGSMHRFCDAILQGLLHFSKKPSDMQCKGVKMMKKLLAFILSMVLILACCASASAERSYINQTRIPAQAVTTVIVTDEYGVWKGANPTRLYVRHYLWSSIEGYYGSQLHQLFSGF